MPVVVLILFKLNYYMFTRTIQAKNNVLELLTAVHIIFKLFFILINSNTYTTAYTNQIIDLFIRSGTLYKNRLKTKQFVIF